MKKSVIDNYIVSLLAKPFVVLTGNSGTGKTRLALRVAEQLEQKNYKVNKWISLEIDGKGKIKNLREEEVRDLCSESNIFIIKIGEIEYQIQIEMSIQITCDDPAFWVQIKEEGVSKVNLGVAVRISVENRHVLIPVGADWTDTRNLLGYVNPFGQEGRTIYEITPMLELLLKALHPNNRYLPHFIILDEMNLSHVERYFSTFLSAMEANRSTSKEEGVPLLDKNHLSIIIDTLRLSENRNEKLLSSAEKLLERGASITLPPNVFIIGTINVDETTYMFSPKVLDRAHIIELETIHPSEYFNDSFGGQDYILKDDIVLKNFKNSIEYRENEFRGTNTLGMLASKWKNKRSFEEAKKEIEILMSGLYSILKVVNFDFGFRTFKETIEYIYFAIHYNRDNSEWASYMDNVILQKILPKLHGNRRQLSDVLENLFNFLNKEKVRIYLVDLTIEVEHTNLDLPRSLIKLNKMRSSLEINGYTSFIG